jgi:hypothetical protein
MEMVNGLKDLREACLSKANGDTKKANKEMVKIFKEGIAKKEIDPHQVSFKALLEGLVDLSDVDVNNAVEVKEALVSSAFSDITTIITHSLVIEPYESRMNEVWPLVTVGDAKRTEPEIVKGFTMPGGVKRRLETEAYQETDVEGKYIEVAKSDFGRMISLTMETLFDDSAGDIKDSCMNLGYDAGAHQERFIIETLEGLPRTALEEVLSRAFVFKGTAYTQAQFYSTDHSALPIDKQVNANTCTGGITETGLKNGWNLFANMKDSSGQFITTTPTQIVIHTQNDLVLATLMNTERSLGSAYNDVNQAGPRGKIKVSPITTPFLADTTSLAYMGQFARSLVWLWVQKPQTITAATDSTLALERQIVWRARFNYYGGCAHRDYRRQVRITLT